MPHLLTLLGPSRGAILRRGAVKANLIHHLAHVGGRDVLLRIGGAYEPPRDWIPASGRPCPPALAVAFDRLLAVPTPALTRSHPALRALDAEAAKGEFWAFVGLAFNLLRVWDGDAAFRESLVWIDRARALEPDWAWGALLRGEIRRSLIDYAGGTADLLRAAAMDPAWSWPKGFASRALFQAGTDAGALGILDEAIALDPGAGFLLCWRGEASRRLGRFDDALHELDAGLESDPLYDQGHGWRARVLDALGRHDEAAASLRLGIALCPQFEKARRQLVRSLRGAGRTAAALAELDRAARLNHRNDWLGVWRAEGQPDGAAARQALAELDAHLDRRPSDFRALGWKGETLAQVGRLVEAVAALDGALKGRPRDAWALAWRGEALLRLGRLAEARADLDRSVRLDPDYGRAWAWRGRARLLAGDAAGAADDLTRALNTRRVEYAWISAWRGEARIALGDASGARADLDAAVALDEGHGFFRVLRAKARAALGDAAGARADLDEARRRPGAPCEPATAPRWGSLPWRAVLAVEDLRRAGRATAALRQLAPVLKRHGEAAPWLYLLSYRLKRDACRPAAHRDCDRAFRLDPSCAWVAGLDELPADAAPQARLLADSWRGFSVETSSSALHAYRGQELLRRGQADAGLRALERAAGLEPAGWILAWLGEAYRAAGRGADARAAFDRALALDPRYDNAWAWRGTLRLAEGDAPGALADLDRALKLRPTARAEHDRARVLRALKRWPESLDALERAVRLNPDLGWGGPRDGAAAAALVETRAARASGADERATVWEAESLLRLGRPEEALSVLAAARHPWARALRAEARLALQGLTADAAADLSFSLKKDPRWARSRALAAEAAFRSGKPARALMHAEAAVRLAPYSARLRLLRAKARLARGRRAAARADLDEALRLSPSFAEARVLAEALRAGRAPVVTALTAPLPDAEEPKSQEFFLNYACNAKCPFCFNPPDATPEQEKGLPLGELTRRLLAGRREGYSAVKFIGGEATVRDDLPKILGVARRVGYRSIQLTTNGIRLADGAYALRLVALGVDRVRFSVHGHSPELHDGLVRVPGALAKIERAVAHLRPLGVRLGINYVLNRVNREGFADTMEYFHRVLKVDDVIVYFLRYQGFGALPENKAELSLRFSDAVGPVRAGFARLAALGARWRPQLIHFPPCVAPELSAHMLDWTVDPAGAGVGNTADDRVTLPDGTSGLIHEITNKGKRRVGACASCALKDRCFGVEENYAAEFGEAEFHPVRPEEALA